MIVDGQLAEAIRTATTWVLPVIFAVTLHEAAHGFVALRFGDDTALRAGRVSLNPLNHIDLFGTILLPLFGLLTALFFWWQVRVLHKYRLPEPIADNAPRRDVIS